MEIYRVRKISDILLSSIRFCGVPIKNYQVEQFIGLGFGWSPVSQHNYLWQGWRAIKKIMIFMLIAFSLAACGSPVEIHYHFNTPPAVVSEMAGKETYGVSHREYKIKPDNWGYWNCDIYIIPESDMDDGYFPYVVRHEEEHCHEGSGGGTNY